MLLLRILKVLESSIRSSPECQRHVHREEAGSRKPEVGLAKTEIPVQGVNSSSRQKHIVGVSHPPLANRFSPLMYMKTGEVQEDKTGYGMPTSPKWVDRQRSVNQDKSKTPVRRKMVTSEGSPPDNCHRVYGEKHKGPNHDIASEESLNDKYLLGFTLRRNNVQKIRHAQGNATYEAWKGQMHDGYGFIPLGDLRKYNGTTSARNIPENDVFKISDIINATGEHNFLNKRVLVKSQLNIAEWEKQLHDYWDTLLIDLIKYGFPLDVDPGAKIYSDEKNHKSAMLYPSHVDTYLREEKQFGAILGPFKEKPHHRLHCSPYMTRDKPGSVNLRVIID